MNVERDATGPSGRVKRFEPLDLVNDRRQVMRGETIELFDVGPGNDEDRKIDAGVPELEALFERRDAERVGASPAKTRATATAPWPYALALIMARTFTPGATLFLICRKFQRSASRSIRQQVGRPIGKDGVDIEPRPARSVAQETFAPG